jgi:hypothetical protein
MAVAARAATTTRTALLAQAALYGRRQYLRSSRQGREGAVVAAATATRAELAAFTVAAGQAAAVQHAAATALRA